MSENHSSNPDAGSTLREWSSLIGIITAIVGNFLISFALNIQRYAHIRLAREHEEQKQPWDVRHRDSIQKGYGTQQSEIAETRIKANLNAPLKDQQPTNGQNHREEEYVHVPKAHSPSLHSRSSSESTLKPFEKPRPQPARKTYLKSPYWWMGIILMVCGEAGNFIAYGFAPASIVSPLGVVALVSNCIIAPCLLHERFRQRDFWGVLVAIGGAVTIVLSAKNSETKMGPQDVWAAITRWEFETYLGITAALIVVLIWASGSYGGKTILIDLGLVALCGGYTALSTKGVASLLSDTLWRTLTFPVTYLLVLILVVSALAQIRYVNRALQRFDSTQVIPVQFVLFTISVIIGSAVLYRDFQSADASRFGKFFGGCALTFLGVYLITSGRARNDDGGDDGDSLDDEENTIGLVDEERYQDVPDTHEQEPRRRKSSVSFALDAASESRRSSTQQVNGRTSSTRSPPPKLQSHTSTTSSSQISGTKSPILEDPWRPSGDVSASSDSRPRLNDTAISSPLLPSEAQRSQPPLTPNTPTTTSPNKHPRRSMARLAPGPYVSPLSSSLSAVVADELRRGGHHPDPSSPSSPSSPFRRRPSALRKSRSQRATLASLSSAADDTPALSSFKSASAKQPFRSEDGGDGNGNGGEGGEGGRPAVTQARRSMSVSAANGDSARESEGFRQGGVAAGGGEGSRKGKESE